MDKATFYGRTKNGSEPRSVELRSENAFYGHQLRFVCHDLRTVFQGSELRSVEKSTSHESERGDVRIMTYNDRARGVRHFYSPSSRQSRDAAQAVPASASAAGAALNEPWQADIKC